MTKAKTPDRTAAEWEAEQERLEAELAGVMVAIEEREATIQRLVFIEETGGEDTSQEYASHLSELSELRGRASRLRSALHLLPASLSAAREREAEAARVEAEAKLAELRGEAVKACAQWDKACKALAKSYGRLRSCQERGIEPCKVLGRSGLFPLRAYPFEESLSDELQAVGYLFDTFPPHVTSVGARGTGLADRLGLAGKS